MYKSCRSHDAETHFIILFRAGKTFAMGTGAAPPIGPKAPPGVLQAVRDALLAGAGALSVEAVEFYAEASDQPLTEMCLPYFRQCSTNFQ